jgi:hypothetical protein
MHMWHHVTNHLIISTDKDSNSENRIKLRVRDSGVWWSVVECGGVWWSVVECGQVCWSVLECAGVYWSVLRCVGVCWSVLECTEVCRSVVGCGGVWWSVVECGRVWWSVVECGGVWWSVVECYVFLYYYCAHNGLPLGPSFLLRHPLPSRTDYDSYTSVDDSLLIHLLVVSGL